MVLGLYVSLLVMAMLILAIFHSENVIVYNGIKYPVKYDFLNNRVECRLFGNVKRFIRSDNNYNIFGNVYAIQ